MHIFSKLGLDDNQSKEVKAIVFKMQKEMVQNKPMSRLPKIELREILGKDPVDVKVAETKQTDRVLENRSCHDTYSGNRGY